MNDLTVLTDTELEELRVAVAGEVERRAVLATAAEQAETLNASVVAALGRVDGEEWVQPAGAHDSFRAGDTVTHGGTEWESLVDWNVWEPGVSGWRQITEDPDSPPEWVQPTGAHDAYQTGDRVTFEGQVYESLIDANVWSPAVYPAGWQLILEGN
jgi:hypothetical protein